MKTQKLRFALTSLHNFKKKNKKKSKTNKKN